MERPHIVVMGVSGVGKTTVARLLAARTRAPFLDADDLHPPANRRKLIAGEPLSDDDRRPWLAAVRDRMAAHDGATGGGPGLVVACSALRRAYRDTLREVARPVVVVELTAEPDLVEARLAARRGHFASARIVESQFGILEPLEPDERGVVCPVTSPPEEIVEVCLAAVLDKDSAGCGGDGADVGDGGAPGET